MKIDSVMPKSTSIQNIVQDQQKTSNALTDDKMLVKSEQNSSPSIDETKSSVEKANKMLFKNNTHLKFDINEECERVIVRIIDDETGEVLKEIPDEDFVEMMHKLCEIAGIFIDERC